MAAALSNMAPLPNKAATPPLIPPPADVQGAQLDPDALDSVGRAVWWSEWSFEMNVSK